MCAAHGNYPCKKTRFSTFIFSHALSACSVKGAGFLNTARDLNLVNIVELRNSVCLGITQPATTDYTVCESHPLQQHEELCCRFTLTLAHDLIV